MVKNPWTEDLLSHFVQTIIVHSILRGHLLLYYLQELKRLPAG